MSVKIDASGRRSVQVEVEVPGTPEQVWQAIATGPGVSSWFVPTKVAQALWNAWMNEHFASPKEPPAC